MNYTWYYQFMKGILKSHNLALFLIVVVGFLFRWYNFEKGFSFAHDQDLYSWIAKDIVINHHQRLVGQITSVAGVFIGSFYYYLMSFFYWVFKMNPMSAMIPLTIIGLAEIVSVYWVARRHFDNKTAIVWSFIQACSVGIAMFDRWSVPTQPTILWSIWFLASILELYKGNIKFLAVYAFLIGFVWQLHIALLPLLPIPLLAYLLNKGRLSNLLNLKNIKVLLVSGIILGATISPLVIFELKYNFSQVRSILVANKNDLGGPTGFKKMDKVLDASSREIQQRLLWGWEIKAVTWYWIVIVLMLVIVSVKKWIERPLILYLLIWVGIIMAAQFWSKRIVSEYYFTNILPVILMLVSVFLAKTFSRKLLYVLGLIYLTINIRWLYSKSDIDQSYYYRIRAVEYIKQDVEKNHYPCVAVNYIAEPGFGVGFRYLFWYKSVNLVKPGTPGVVVYNIAIPWQVSAKENPAVFGRFGILLPKTVLKPISKEDCNRPDYRLDPMLGYTE